MRILCTFPGRYGDLLWSLPTIRALSRRIGAPVDLQIAGEFASIAELLQQQPYIGKVWSDHRWRLTPPDAWEAPPLASIRYDHVFHLGYRGWPTRPLPFEVLHTLNECLTGSLTQHDCGNSFREAELDLQTPWITIAPKPDVRPVWTAAFTEAHFELKYGLWELLTLHPHRRATTRHSWTSHDLGTGPLSLSTGGRWQTEAGHGGTASWIDMAEWIAASPLLLTDCSAPHVLAVAIGTPVVMVEPMEARWNPIFYPLGKTGRVRLVTGLDGLPTTDSRHTADVLKEVLRG